MKDTWSWLDCCSICGAKCSNRCSCSQGSSTAKPQNFNRRIAMSSSVLPFPRPLERSTESLGAIIYKRSTGHSVNYDLDLRMLWLNGISSLLYQQAARLTYISLQTSCQLLWGFLMDTRYSCSFWKSQPLEGCTFNANKFTLLYMNSKERNWNQTLRVLHPKMKAAKLLFLIFPSSFQTGTEHDSQPNQTMAPAGDKLYFKHSFRNSDGLFLKQRRTISFWNKLLVQACIFST